MKRKMNSERGASITFALLIFLVCAIVSSAVIVAGTTAAGRMSQRADTDRRYYAVSSAMELLLEDFNDKTVTLECKKTVDATSIADSAVIITKVSDKDGTELTGQPLLLDVSKVLVMKRINGTEDSLTPDGTYELTTSLSDPNTALNCTIKEYVRKDGVLILEVSNTIPAGSNTPVYTLQATFTANISESKSNYTQVEGGTTTAMEDIKTVLKWSLNGIKKGV